MSEPAFPITREVYVLNGPRGTITYSNVEQFALTVIQGYGVNDTLTFEAKAHVLTDGATPAVDLTDLCATASIDCRKACIAGGTINARATRQQHIADLVEAINIRRRPEARTSADGVSPDYQPTTSEVERGWMMRQFALDREAGRESDPIAYAREFQGWLRDHVEAAIQKFMS